MYKVTQYRARNKDSIVWGGEYIDSFKGLSYVQALDKADKINAMIHFNVNGAPSRSYVATITRT